MIGTFVIKIELSIVHLRCNYFSTLGNELHSSYQFCPSMAFCQFSAFRLYSLQPSFMLYQFYEGHPFSGIQTSSGLRSFVGCDSGKYKMTSGQIYEYIKYGMEVIMYQILKRLFKPIILKYSVSSAKYISVIFAYSILFHALW